MKVDRWAGSCLARLQAIVTTENPAGWASRGLGMPRSRPWVSPSSAFGLVPRRKSQHHQGSGFQGAGRQVQVGVPGCAGTSSRSERGEPEEPVGGAVEAHACVIGAPWGRLRGHAAAAMLLHWDRAQAYTGSRSGNTEEGAGA